MSRRLQIKRSLSTKPTVRLAQRVRPPAINNLGLRRIDPNPPPVSLNPWNRVTILIKSKGEKCVYVKDVAQTISNQLDPQGHALKPMSKADGCRIQMKLQRVRVYAPTATTLGLSIEDFEDNVENKSGRDQLAGVLDIGTPTKPPALEFNYSSKHRNSVIRTDDQWWDVPLFDVSATSTTDWIAYVHLHWCFDGPIKFSYSIPSVSDISSDIKSISNTISRSQPSTVSRVVDGVLQTASVVATVAGVSDLSRLEQRLSQLEATMSSLSFNPSESDDT